MDKWLNIGVLGSASWPAKETTISFGGHDLLLRPATRETEASIHINLIKINDVEALTLANRFLSVLSWCSGQGMTNLYGWSGNPCPVSVPRKVRTVGSSHQFPFSRDDIQNPKVKLALALYREARSIDSVPYSFLGFFKILNVFWNDKTTNKINPLIDGIKETLNHIKDNRVQERLNEISANGDDPALYLYKSGRCAVAHAFSSPVVDPDDLTDLRRLSADLIIITRIAEYLIENTLGVRRTLF